MSGLVDQWGQPLRRDVMTREISGAGGPGGLTGVRSPIAGYPTDGMTPARLADLLRSAAEGEPLEYFEMAELIEERGSHMIACHAWPGPICGTCWAASCDCGFVFDAPQDAHSRWPSGRLRCAGCAP